MYFFNRPLSTVICGGIALCLVTVLGAWAYDVVTKDLRSRFGGSNAESATERGARAQPRITTIAVDSSSAWVQELKLNDQEARATLAELDVAIATWNEQVAALLHNEAGRCIASNKGRCEEFVAVTESPRAGPAEVVLWRAKLDEMAKQVEQALAAQQRSSTSDGLPKQVKGIVEEARAALRRYREHLAMLAALTAATQHLPPAAETLSLALLELQRAEAGAQAQRLTVARQQAQEQANLKDEKRLLEREKKREEFERAYAEMKNYLLPFTSEASTQLDERGFKPSAVRGPVSWIALQRYLKQDEKVALKLSLVVTLAKERPLGMFPAYSNNRKKVDVPTILRIQQFLTTYGEQMVEKRLLAP
ncbi:MAG: hypothetical protein L0Z62_23030 [Gemmataceae bacterium]|nr:hypothetical protein [Gemmataceae bacterium]